jgi:glycosyltransferase involved in cell wall biosynthesis
MRETSRPLRLAFVAPGNSIHTRRWLEYFARQGHQVGLVSYGPLTIRIEGIDLLLAHRSLSQDAGLGRYAELGRAAMRTREAIRGFAPDLVHAHFVTGPGWLVAATGCRPFVVSAWGSDILVDSRRRALGFVNRFVLRRADCVLCDSDELAAEVEKLAPKVRVERAMWGVDVERFSPGEPSAGVEDAAQFTVLPIRGLRPLQQPEVVVTAFTQLRDEGVDARLLLKLGPSDDAVPASVARLVAQIDPGDAVEIVERVPHEQLAELYRRADVCVSVPTTDGTSVALLEAMATGAAVVASDIPANREWITDGENGLLVPSADAPALGKALLRLAADPEERARLGRAARQTAVERAAEGPSLAAAEEIYRSLLGPAGTAAA